LGLEIEEQRTNLMLQSEAYNVSPWVSASPYSVTANIAIAPDGAQTADALIVESGQSSFNTNVTRQVVSKAATATQYTRSGYFKALGATTTVRLQDFGNLSANNASVVISLVDGSVVTAPTVTGGFSGASVAVSNAGNGWWRVNFTYTTDAHTSLTVRSFPYVGAAALTGDGFSGLLAWGAQLEAGAFATSYIPTVASQVTRAEDLSVMTGGNFNSFFNQTEGSFAVLSSSVSPNSDVTLISVDDGTTGQANQIDVRITGGTAYRPRVRINGVSVVDMNPGSFQLGNTNFLSFGYKRNDHACCLNANTVATDINGDVPNIPMTRFQIGKRGTSGVSLNGTIKKIAYYPKRLIDAELQGLTTV
jgi:hypothetical protein